ncbi:MAG: hypothetical protein G01um101438_439 [Parcubacteria group bacterium Gr01-1014_38]|nr:MAG: hypothetical protein G01um101438_439 [Parcubacteria group bacterium Gr01-1014_38]
MKVFLFLYPIREYIREGQVGRWHQDLRKKGYDPGRLNELIDARYREKDYQVVWVLFGEPHAPDQPNMRNLSPLVTIYLGEDAAISCGVTFEEHVREKRYPDPASILTQLPVPIDHLVLGGFHQWDCIDTLAEYAHKQGLDVFVDEDCTECFFSRTMMFGAIPLHRTRKEQAAEVTRGLTGSDFIERIRKRRKSRPWLVQI